MLTAGVHRGRVVRRDDERRIPVGGMHRIAQYLFGARPTPRFPVATACDVSRGITGANVLHFPRLDVGALQAQELRRRVHGARIERIRRHMKAVTAADAREVFVQHAAGGPAGTRSHPAPVVLQATIHVERHRVIGGHAIELRQRQRRDVQKLVAAIVADADTAVVEFHHVATVGRIHPHEAVVAVRGRARRRERLAAVIAERIRIQHVHALIIVRIDDHLTGVHRPRIPVTHERPRSAGIFAAIYTGLAHDVGRAGVIARTLLDADREDLRIPAIHADADASVLALRQAMSGKLAPGDAGVGALPECTARAAAVEAVGAATTLIRGRVQHVRIVPVHRHISGASFVVHEQRARPAASAVGGAVHPAVPAGAPHRALRGHVGDVRIARVQLNAADVHAGGQSHILPRLAAIGALVHAVAPAHALAAGALAGAHPNDLRVGLKHRHVANGMDRRVEGGAPGHAVVGGAPEPARGTGHVPRTRVRLDDVHVDHAAAHRRGADVTQSQATQISRGEGCRRLGRQCGGKGPQQGREQETGSTNAHKAPGSAGNR